MTDGGIAGFMARASAGAGPRWVNAIVQLRSEDDGQHWSMSPVGSFNGGSNNRCVLIPEPRGTQKKEGLYGFFHPTNIVKEGSYWYAFCEARLFSSGAQYNDSGFVAVRTPDLDNPTAWQFFNVDGTWHNVDYNYYQGNLAPQQPKLFFKTTNWNPETQGDQNGRMAQAIRFHVPTQKWVLFGFTGVQANGFCFCVSSTLANPQFETNGQKMVDIAGGGSWGEYGGNHYIGVFDPTSTDQNYQTITGRTALCWTGADSTKYRVQDIQLT